MDNLKECPFCGGKDIRFMGYPGMYQNSHCECKDCNTIGPAVFVDDEKAATEAWNRRAVPQANAEQDARSFLQPDDLATLHRFMDFCTDSGADGYSIPKEQMKRLAEIGAIESKGFNRYQVTTFGLYVLTMDADGSASLPLKTYAEYDADSRAAHEAKIFGGAASNAASEVRNG